MSDRHDKTLAQVGAPAGVNARYRVVRELGAGGMGFVHLAEDTKLPRQVAIKTIKPDLCANAEILKRIDRECKLHAKIGSHPHIVTLYDRLEDEGHISLVMEYVPGETLQDLLTRNAKEGRRLQWEQGVGIASQVLEALARIHASGIVHRDIKPSNILLAQDDVGRFTAKLMDFGIARLEVEEDGYTNLTREGGSGPGTPLYMAPEQIDPKTFGAIAPSTDLYATGVMLYQIISGRPPFGGSLTEIFNGHLNSPLPPLEVDAGANVPPGLADILRKALAKHPKERFSSARDFRESLERLRGASTPSELAIATAASFDPSKTMSSSEATASGFEKGGTLLDTTTAGGARKKKGGGLAIAAVAALVLLAAGGFGLFTLLGNTASGNDTDPASGETATAPEPDGPVAPADTPPTEATALGQLADPSETPADAPPVDTAANVDAAVLGGLDPANLPAQVTMPDGPVEAPDDTVVAPLTPAAATPPSASALDAYQSAAPAAAPEPDDAGTSGSALDALLNNQTPVVPDAAVNPPAPEPPAAVPAASPAPAPAPKPKSKPAAAAPAPKPKTDPPKPAAPITVAKPETPSNPWGKVKVKSVEDRKVD